MSHVYSHPESNALGRHHADAEGRARFDPDAARARGLTDPEIETLAAHEASMDELDLHHGTKVIHCGPNLDEHAYIRVEWTDKRGQPRATSIEPGFFAAHFQPDPDAEHPGAEGTQSPCTASDYVPEGADA